MTEAEALACIAELCERAEADVAPTPPQIIDREMLLQVLRGWFPNTMSAFLPKLADRILALQSPADGVWISRDDIPRVVYALRNQDHTSDADWVLANRLEGK